MTVGGSDDSCSGQNIGRNLVFAGRRCEAWLEVGRMSNRVILELEYYFGVLTELLVREMIVIYFDVHDNT